VTARQQDSQELALAEQVLDLVRAQGGRDVEAEAMVTRTELALTRFAVSFVHQNVADVTTIVRLRLHLDGRTAAGATTMTSADTLSEFVARTLEGARLLPPDPGWPGVVPPTPATGSGSLDGPTAAATPSARAERVRAFVDAAGGLETAGFCRTRTTWGAFANSAGQVLAGATSDAAMDGIARARSGTGGPPSDGVARFASPRLADLDGALVGARAAAKARAGVDPVDIPPGTYHVVLEPAAAADIVFVLAVEAFNGRAMTDGTSFAELGAAQFDGSVSIIDDATAPGSIGLPFDADGTPKRRLELVRNGTTVAAAHDRRTAAQAGTASTGHGIGAASFGAFPANLALLPAGEVSHDSPDSEVHEVDGPIADSGVAALVSDVDHGLLVSDIWYTRVLDPRRLVVTGLTRNGVWVIERGEVTRAVSTLRFTQSYPGALAPGHVAGIGPASPHAVGEDWIESDLRAPALSLPSWNITGGAAG
jgi:predicted Zn-dependent protease